MLSERAYRVRLTYMTFIALLALFSLVVRPGLNLKGNWEIFWRVIDIWIILSFFANAFIRFFTAPEKRAFLRKNSFEFAIIFVFIMQLIIMTFFLRQPDVREAVHQLGIMSIAKIYIILAQLFILIEVIGQIGQLNTRFTSLPFPPSMIFLGSFLFAILSGTFLLMLPGATKNGISFINAIFTATSATCVTGLSVVPTGATFTQYGHAVILGLIQIGGLGLMTFATFAALILKGELGIKERVVVGDILNFRVMNKVKSLIGAIIGFTVTIELLGAVAIFLAIKDYPHKMVTDGSIFFSLFHSISAFCNAGLSLWDDNLLRFSTNTLGSLTIMTLIVLGGIGFIVLADCWNFLKLPFRKKFLSIPHLSLHTKLVIVITVTLIIGGALLFYASERHGQLSLLSEGYRWLASFFHAVTARTAGFNTLNTGALLPSSLFLLIILMFIGASPGSTGGGIKTTTIGTIILLIISRIKGEQHVSFFGRTVPIRVVHQAAMVLLLALGVATIGVFLLLILEPDKSLMQLLFEQISAFGTVGLSTGITPDLSDGGKIVLMITMFLGRIGPLTFLSAIWFRHKPSRMKFPDEEIMIG